jgi:DNA-binding MarR family transcriptional regulator
MSGDPAGAATGQPGPAEQASGQQASGQHGAADQASGQREQGAADQASGQREQGAADQASAGMDAAQRDAWQPSPAGWELPWLESPTSGTGPRQRAELEVAFAAAMRRTGSLMQLMGQAAAERIGINSTDLNCLNILSFSGQMTAGELARATGLTTASITGVIDRLEEAGFVSRERDPHDRRRVVVRLALDKALREVASVFVPMLRDWREMAARYSDDELRLIVDFYGQMEQVFHKHLVRLRDG